MKTKKEMTWHHQDVPPGVRKDDFKKSEKRRGMSPQHGALKAARAHGEPQSPAPWSDPRVLLGCVQQETPEKAASTGVSSMKDVQRQGIQAAMALCNIRNLASHVLVSSHNPRQMPSSSHNLENSKKCVPSPFMDTFQNMHVACPLTSGKKSQGVQCMFQVVVFPPKH